MKRISILLILLTFEWMNIAAQVPVSEIEGFLEVYHSEDSSSLYIGKSAGHKAQPNTATFGMRNTFVGSQAGNGNTTGLINSFFGDSAGFNNTSGKINSFYGVTSGLSNTSGRENSFFGTSSGANNTTGDYNSFFGRKAGDGNTTGDANTIIGTFSGQKITTQSNMIIIGANAGPASTPDKDSLLYIDVEQTNDPLIYGDFYNDTIRVNGSLDVTNGITGTFNGISDINRKEYLLDIDTKSLLHKVMNLPILEWQYKSSTDRHIGPMAQDFFAAFGLGQGETTIATVDADGVALAAIQALAKENEALKIKNKEMENRNIEIEKRLVRLERLFLKNIRESDQ